MKLLFTIIMVLGGLSLFSQVQLDSIIQTTEYGEVLTTKLEYTNENLSRFDGLLLGDNLVVDFYYTIDAQFKKWDFIQDEDTTVLDFTYDSDNLLDHFSVSNDGEAFANYDYTYENGILKSIIIEDLDGPDTLAGTRIDFAFSNELLTSLAFFDISDGYDFLEFKDVFTYNSNSKMITRTRLSDYDESATDSLSYDAEGSVIDYHLIATYDGIPTEISKIETYTSDPSVNFDMILNPTVMYDFFYEIAGILTSEKQLAIKNGNKIDMSVGDTYYGNSTSEWFYSTYVGTDERVLTTPISVYPNPTVDRIRIESEERITRFYIYDFGGALISEGIPENNNAIDVFQLSAGSYTVICSDKDDKHYFAQFVKQ